jgi:hypothetical protein
LGEVYVALDQELHREVALKEIQEDRAHDAASRSRFLLEAEITGGLPSYPSGHSTVSSAAAKILELFTGSDRFGDTEKRKAGLLTEPGFECAIIQMRDGKLPPGHDKLTCDVALALPTFSATAKMAGISRVMGGYHIQSDNIHALELGRQVAEECVSLAKG